MTDQYIPKRDTMTLAELFRFGPWKSVVLWWLGGAAMLAGWLAWPASRIAAVAVPALCALLCAAIFGMTTAIFLAPFIHRRGAGRLLIAASMIVGGGAGYAAAALVFHAVATRGCDCAPLVATRESTAGFAASYALPILAFLIWCRWGFSGLSGVGRDHDSSRMANYSRQFMLRLPTRVIVTAAALFAAYAFIRWNVSLPDGLAPDAVIRRIHANEASAMIAAKSGDALGTIEKLRQARAAAAEDRLANFEFDAARPLMHDAACTLVMPGVGREPEVAESEEAFEQLESELRNGFATWRPSAASGRTVLALLPMHIESGVLRVPFLWSQARNSVDPAGGTISTGRVSGTFLGEKIVDARLFTLHGGGRATNVGASLALLGTSGVDAKLPEVLSRRLGRDPVGGTSVVGSGAMCAMWEFGDLAIRLGPLTGPNDPPPTPASAVWLTYYDRALRHAARSQLPAELAATFDCGDDQLQSH